MLINNIFLCFEKNNLCYIHIIIIYIYKPIFVTQTHNIIDIPNVILYNNNYCQNHQEGIDVSECENPSFVKEKKIIIC